MDRLQVIQLKFITKTEMRNSQETSVQTGKSNENYVERTNQEYTGTNKQLRAAIHVLTKLWQEKT